MESYEVLEQAIPKKMSDKVAQYLGITAGYVRRWRREPDSDDAPTASGQRSILDRICDLIDVVWLVNPSGTGLIVNFINAHYDRLLQVHAQPIEDFDDRAETVEELLVQMTEAVNRLNREGCTNATISDLVDVKNVAIKVIKRVEKTMSEEETV